MAVVQPGAGAAFFKQPKIGPMTTPQQPPLNSFYQKNGTGGFTGTSLGGYPASISVPPVYTNQGALRSSQYNPAQAAANFIPASSGINAPAGISKPQTQGYTPQPPAMAPQGGVGPMQIQTSITTPETLSDEDKHGAWVRARNKIAKEQGNHQWNMKNLRTDAGGASMAAGPEAEAASQAALVNATIPFKLQYDETLARRTAEQNRDAEANQLAQLGIQSQGIHFNDQMSRQSALLNALLGRI